MEIRIEAQIRAVGGEEEARARATARRRRRVETKRVERFETVCIERERTEAQSSWRGRSNHGGGDGTPIRIGMDRTHIIRKERCNSGGTDREGEDG